MCATEERFAAGTGRYRLEARVLLLGDDLNVVITGGDQPHIGAVAVAYVAADGSIDVDRIIIGNHREDVVVVPAAERIAAALHNAVTVCAGMHWDQIDAAGIENVLVNSRLLIDAVIAAQIGDK